MEDLNSSLAIIKASVVDKIKIFEKNGWTNSKHVAGNPQGLEFFSKNLKPVKTIVDALARQTNEHDIDNKHDMQDNFANDTINVFDKILADCTINLDQTTDPFDIILEENEILSEHCFDVTISDVTRVDTEVRDINSESAYRCGKCGETFNFFSRLRKHILAKSCHISATGNRKLKCDVCRSPSCRLKAHIKC